MRIYKYKDTSIESIFLNVYKDDIINSKIDNLMVIIMGKLYLICGDYILNSNGMDAIVNASNKYMINGGGICGAIYKASGPELLEYCKQNFKDNMINGEVRITPGFRLNTDIIHILAPKYYEEKDPIKSLINCYKNLLENIKNKKYKKYKKVLLCSLGTGVHGYKHEEVAKPLIDLLYEFCNNNEVKIYLNNINPLCKDIYLKYYLSIKNIDLKKDLENLNIMGIRNYLELNFLNEIDIIEKYKNFVKDLELEDLCLSQKLICLQYLVYNCNVTKEQLNILIESL